ncbi:MAG TPA: zinc dependent phospholipase C family protein [Bryobacteraceae bacterium]|jgi:hypothetical protein|nr:zinc dependent phospholipase C family protein [Bryobacteraceae bacterium]
MRRALLLFIFFIPGSARAYSVLTHEAIVDSLWNDSIVPALHQRFPDAGPDQLLEAHAYAYGGCIIQDLGYYPFGSHLFSDLVHYIRSADFLQALLDESGTLDEYAFALGAVAHYGGDTEGHKLAVNKAVPILYPKLQRKFGNEVTYGDDPSSHLKTEFGFDVLQVARGHYPPKAYHDFIGFKVSKELLERTFEKTYGLKLKDIFSSLDLALGTYRFTVSTMIPNVTQAAWKLKRKEILEQEPQADRRQFVYNITKVNYTKEWGTDYAHPGFGVRIIVFISRLLPRIGPFRSFGFKVPTPQTEKMFEDSFDAAVNRDRTSFSEAKAGGLKLINRDLDTGAKVSPGEYALTDRTYDKLLAKLAAKKFMDVAPELRQNILAFYAAMKTPDPHGIQPQLAALNAFSF